MDNNNIYSGIMVNFVYLIYKRGLYKFLSKHIYALAQDLTGLLLTLFKLDVTKETFFCPNI